MRRASFIGVAMAVAAGVGVPSVAPAAGKAHHKRHFTAIAVGAQISTNGNRFETVYRVIRSPDGSGAGMQDGVLLGSTYPVTGNDTMKLFYADGVQRMSDTFTRVTPHTDGVGAIAGKGTCTTGSGLHTGETCTYTITGTYDLNTGVTKLRFAGTFTR
ncbi:MAG: hypothetical protein ACRDPM_21785 [Solirubrobacteraceae bacterium]